jgi:hypothetical protein
MPAKKKTSKSAATKSSSKKASDPAVEELIARRDKLLAAAETEEKKEEIHMLLKGMYKCAKDKDVSCLDKISEGLKKVGGRPRRRSRSRPKK